MNDKWVEFAIRIQSIAQAGLQYGKDKYDRERYEELRQIAAEKDCLFPAKRVLPRAEQIIENVTTYLLVSRGHMSSLTESEKQMIIEFLKRE